MATIDVAIVYLESLKPWFEQACGLISQQEQQRIDRLHRAIDQYERTLTYALHRSFLARIFNCNPYHIDIYRDNFTAPQLGANHQGYTSLSHTDGWAAFAYARQGPVGIDIELISKLANVLEIRQRIVSPEEDKSINAIEIRRQPLELLRLWVRKEAVLKACGQGLAIEMPSFSCPLQLPMPLPDNSAYSVSVVPIEDGKNYISAVAGLAGNHVLTKYLDWNVDTGQINWR